LIDIPDCPLHKPNINDILKLLRQVLPPGESFPLAYYIQTSAQIVLIVKSKNILSNSWISRNNIKDLKMLGVEGLWLHINPSAGRRLFEKTHWELIFGEKRSIDSNGYYYGPGAFQQLIPSLYLRSIDEVLDFFNLSQDKSVVDLYCGTGASMKSWCTHGSNVIGVEVSGEAIECAKLNASDATILRGACRQRIPQIREWTISQRNAGKRIYLYVNPPRTGIEKEVLDWITGEEKPEKIAYLSCSAGTLAKNLDVLAKNGYTISRLVPYDFFPQTIHVECLALLERV
jgi:23S rRNA (uracil1939-C5)-methyltransferase